LISPRKAITTLLYVGLTLLAASGRAAAEWPAVSAVVRNAAAPPSQLSQVQGQAQPTYTPPKRGAPDYRESGATRDLSAQRRVALVIGDGAYQQLPPLENPVNDAKLIAATLQSVGFRLIGGHAQTDLDRAGFERAIRQFGAQLTDGSVALFYYAGHGLQFQGANYLVPVTANPVTAADIDFELIDAQTVLRQMEVAGSSLNIVILDACRNNPFDRGGLRDAGQGLAVMRAPRGTLISYATQPGNVAMDGTTGHSPYTSALAEVLRRPGLPVSEVFNEVGLLVDRATSGRQQPWVASSPLDGVFYFLAPTTVNLGQRPPAQLMLKAETGRAATLPPVPSPPLVGDAILFARGKVTLSPLARATLAKQADFLQNHPSVTVTVKTFCANDEGVRTGLQVLAQLRGNQIRDVLQMRGIDAGRIRVELPCGSGDAAPAGLDQASAAETPLAVLIRN
jgi:outer membrane protein OmpA-like peptidoglycan-associated protein